MVFFTSLSRELLLKKKNQKTIKANLRRQLRNYKTKVHVLTKHAFVFNFNFGSF